ncbi:MAG: EipA family protein [Desulfobacterales bacterium]
MKRLTVYVLVVGLVMCGLAFAKGEKKPDATLKLSEGQVALGIGWSWGKGDLNMNGKEHPFKIKGLSVGDVGISEAKAEGGVYNLKKLADFNGTYSAVSAEGTMVEGAGATVMRNEKGVEIHLLPKTKGVNLKLAAEGVKFTLE